ncbi:MAG: RHS repeat-associated core domain-containing protein, partial [Pseudomonadota bacterium]
LRYDQRGRKIAMQDPAMGQWQYAHNAFGELVWQRDALGQTTTQAYDTLGRLVQRSEPDLISRWSHDRRFDGSACGKSIGKLCEAVTDNGYRRLHHYDSLGRPQSTSTVLDNPAQPAVISVTYDEATGRIASQRWPTDLEARYEYTEGGFLRKVIGTAARTQTQTTPATSAPPAAPVTYEVLAMDPQGHITHLRQGRVLTLRSFDAATGRLRHQQAGAVLSQSYGYDSLGNLTSRADTSPGVGTRESFAYDRLNRLNLYTVTGGALTTPQATEILYDPRGNIRYKSDVGTYWYDPARPTRLTNVTLDAPPGASLPFTGTRALAYAFDDSFAQPAGAPPPPPGMPPRPSDTVTLGNGNLVYTVSQDRARQRQSLRFESYTSFNKPREFSYSDFAQGSSPPASADRTLSFVYGPEHQRIRQQVRIAGSAPSALSSGSTWYLHGEGEQALSYEKEVKDSGLTEHRHYLQAGGMVFAMVVTRTGALAGQKPIATRYFHHDHLGSIAAMTDEGGQLVERLAYDPWGKRRHVDGMPDASDSIIGWATERGYTMHEHLDEIGVIHMNGRVYDPLIGRFMSADPFIQSPRDLQSHNRYAYVLNNPLAYTDPSGYFSFKKLFRTAVSIVVAVYFGPAVIGNFAGAGQLFTAASFGGSAAAAGIANAAVAGFLSGAISSGSLKGAVNGAFSGALFFGVGEFVPGAAGGFGKVLAHSAAGCISAAAGGGHCKAGAMAAGFAEFAGPAIGDLGSVAANVTKSAVLGGVGSSIGGGRFEDGAVTGAFGYLFNECAHGNCWGRPETLDNHFVRHGGSFGATSAEEYAKQAQHFRERGLNNPATEFRIDKDGTLRIYDRATNTFGSYNPDGSTKTFYRPGSKERYWDMEGRDAKWGNKVDSPRLEKLNRALRWARILGRYSE